MIWLSPNEGHLRQTNVMIHLLCINLGCVTRIFMITGWRFQLVAASDNRNQSVCMLQKHVFCREKVKGWNGHVYALPWGNSQNAQNAMRNFQMCTKSHEDLPKIHKIPWLTSNNAQNPMRNFQNVHNPMRNSQICIILRGTSKNAQNPTRNSKTAQNHMRNFQKCRKFHEELPKVHKIPWGTSKYVQNPTMIFRKCTKFQEEFPKCTQSHEELSNIHNPTRNFQKCPKSQEKLPNMHKIPRGSSENAQNPRVI